MEIKAIVPEDLSANFKSKQDLYNILTVDCKLINITNNYSKVFSPSIWIVTNAFSSQNFIRREESM